MAELGTRRTYRKGAGRKLSACKLRAPYFYPKRQTGCRRFGFQFGKKGLNRGTV